MFLFEQDLPVTAFKWNVNSFDLWKISWLGNTWPSLPITLIAAIGSSNSHWKPVFSSWTCLDKIHLVATRNIFESHCALRGKEILGSEWRTVRLLVLAADQLVAHCGALCSVHWPGRGKSWKGPLVPWRAPKTSFSSSLPSSLSLVDNPGAPIKFNWS